MIVSNWKTKSAKFAVGILLLGVCGAGAIFLWAQKSDNSSTVVLKTNEDTENQKKSSSDSEAPETVRQFWNLSLAGHDVSGLMTSVPREFLDEGSRCHTNPDKKDPNDSSPALEPASEHGFEIALKKTAGLINQRQSILVKATVYREWGNESIVIVDFKRSPDSTLTEQTYFLLFRASDQWRLFADTGAPDFLNKEFADHNCS